mgnify:CR=1 FL=1
MGFEDRTFFVFDNTDFNSTLKHVVMPRVGLNVDIRKAEKNTTVRIVSLTHSTCSHNEVTRECDSNTSPRTHTYTHTHTQQVHPVGVRDDDERATFSSIRMPYITPQFTEDLHGQWNRNGESHDFHAAFGGGSSSSRSRSSTTGSFRSYDSVTSGEEKDT